MDLKEIESKINEIFSRESYRQIIFWYDENKEFEEDIENINLDNAELYVLGDNNWIYTKYYIEYGNKDTNFLVYAPFAQPDDEVNYLADMVHYSTLFTADKVVLIAQDLKIPLDYGSVLKEYSRFWNANSRIEAFKALNITNFSEESIVLGILAVLSNQKTSKFDYIVREVIVNHICGDSICRDDEDNKIIEKFIKFGIEDKFWDLVDKTFKFNMDGMNVNKLIRALVLNYAADLYEGDVPSSWQEYLVKDKNNSRIFVEEFMNNSNYSDIYSIIANDLESKFTKYVKNDDIDSYKYCDSFELFDKNILNHYIDLLYNNQSDLGSEFKELIEDRKKTHFYSKYEDYYLLIKYANLFVGLINEFRREGIPEEIEGIIDSYAGKWAYVDTYYRKFYYHYDKLDNFEEYDKLEDLRQLIENMYVNSFLAVINPKFTQKLEEKSLNDINVPKQWRFYKDNVDFSVKKYKTAVIISDAFRYGCAVELYAELEKDPKRKPSIKPMISTIPSYTALGMASLLPNKEISYEGDTVLVDGKKCASTEEREAILKSYVPNSLAIQATTFIESKINDLRDRFKGLDLVYMYHNQIDSRGDKASSQHEVFDAAQETIKELVKIIKKLRDYGNFSRIIVTADHGFIYKRDSLNESDKVDLKNTVLKRNKRYLLSDSKSDYYGSVSFPMDFVSNSDMYVTVPLGVDVFKAPGNGLNYVHGGASLEECIVPILEIKADKGAKKQTAVGLELASSNYRITNYEIVMTFFQKENISPGVIPLEASIYFVDENDNKISNEIIIYADKNTDSAEDREFKEKFTLSRRQYSKSKDYYLIIKNNIEDVELQRIPFIVDIAFQDDFDF